MRNSLLLLFFLLCGAASTNAQGNLQFNNAILISSTLQTVPAGKVWKIESYTPTSVYGIHGGIPATHNIVINGDIKIVGMSAGLNYNYNSGSHSAVLHSFPIWLPAGSTVIVGAGISSLSVLEFNLVP